MAVSTRPAPDRIFISYRREDAAYPAGWLFDRLADRFGKDQVFKDVDSIQLGDDFVEVITGAVGSCSVLLAVIGKQWLTITDEQGLRRLDNPDDFVRLEIEAALARSIRVIPILVERAQMPRAGQLPASLAKLAHRNALEVSPDRFASDTARLLTVLETTLKDAQSRSDATDNGQDAVMQPEAREQAGQEAGRTTAQHYDHVEPLQHQDRRDGPEVTIVSQPPQAVPFSLASPPQKTIEPDELSAPMAATSELLPGYAGNQENAESRAQRQAGEPPSPQTEVHAGRERRAPETKVTAAAAEPSTPVAPKVPQSPTWILSRPRRQYLFCLVPCIVLFIAAFVGINKAPPRSALSYTMGWIIGLSLTGAFLSLGFFLYARRVNRD